MKFKLDNGEIVESKIVGEPPRDLKWLYETAFEVNGKSVWLLKQSMVWEYKTDQMELRKPPKFYRKVGNNFYVLEPNKAIEL